MNRARLLTTVLSGGGGGVFTPSQRVDLHTWLKADAGTFEDVLMATPAADDNDTVLGWSDQSGNTHHAKNATGLVLKTGIQNSLPVLRGDGAAGHFLKTAQFTALGDRTIYIMAKWDGVLFDYLLDGDTTTEESGLSVSTGPAWVVDAGTPQSTVAGVAAQTYSVLTLKIPASGNSILRVNGTQVLDAAAGNETTTALTIGARFDQAAATCWDGDIGEIVVIAGLDDAAEITQMETYLASRWGVSF